MLIRSLKKILFYYIILLAQELYTQESGVELPLIGDRLSGAVSQTEEEILGRQFLRDLKITKKANTVTLHLLLIKFFCNIYK